MVTDFWKSKTVVITGVGGFLGARLAQMLVERGARPVGLDLATTSPSLRALGLDGRIEIARGDVTDMRAARQALTRHKPDICFHLAGQSKIEDSAAGPVPAFEANVRGTWVFLDACRQQGSIRGIVCASSNHTYGPQPAAPFPETAAFNQLDVYGASKACADLIVRTYARQFGLPAVAVRNTNTYGPADPHTSHLITGTILSLLRGEPPIVNSDGSPVKAYLYVDDTLRAYIALAERAPESGIAGEAFNVTADTPISVKDLVELVVKVSGRHELRPVMRAADLSQKDTYEHLANEKIKARVGWAPQLSLEEGIQQTYAWYKSQGAGWPGGR